MDKILVGLRAEAKDVQETGKVFHKLADDLDNCRSRLAATPKSKPGDCTEARNMLAATQTVFLHTTLEYTTKLNAVLRHERSELLTRALTFACAVETYQAQSNSQLVRKTKKTKRILLLNIVP